MTARTIAIDKSKGDIVISVDADIYCPPNFVNLYISHFQDSSVVAVSSPRIVEGILYTPSMLWSILLKKKPIMYGSNSAFRKWAFFESGGWDLDINQLDLDWMVKEEEEDFGNRLSHLGRCIFDIQAPVVTSNRRYFPTGSFLEDTEICERFARHCVI
ncbi:MAG: hypothetical protein A7315_05975 [Candidatus Altiarchaeales archaeon WOR_SM1_79]|nr:MAG: hypothetical protein A7315_05975 [Candidatus Altiarchaeales archaeon WOR_SM1_79]